MIMSLARPDYPHQLSLFTEPERRRLTHDAIMRRRAEAIKVIVARHADFYELWAAELTLEERLRENTQGDPDQLAALFWQNVWERLMGRSDSWCVMCPSDLHDTCPVRRVLDEEETT